MSGQEQQESKDIHAGGAQKRRFLSSGVIQALMLLNGIILTATAFFVLNIFIQGIINDEYDRATRNTSGVMIEGISGLGHSLETVVSLLTLARNTDQDVLIDNIRNVTSGLTPFDQILWVYEAQPGIWQYKEIYKHDRDKKENAYRLKPDAELIKYLGASQFFNDNKLHAVSDLQGMDYVVEDEDAKSFSRPFALMQAVRPGDMTSGIVIGVSSVRTVLGDAWLQDDTPVSRLSIRDVSTEQPIYHMDRAGESKVSGQSQSQYFNIGDTQWEVILEFAKQKNTAFLEKMPYLILVFGLVLTLFGVLYMRSNHKQTKAQLIMNRMLEAKNMELESEVAERERLHRAIVRAERENRAIIDSVSDIIFETNTNGEILFLNGTWRKITGFDIEQFKKHDLFSMLHPQDQERQRHDFDLLVKGHKQAYRTFTRLRTADGTFRSVELAMSMIRHDESRNLRVVGTFTDVEERRRAERALSEAEKKYRTIVENAAGGIYQLTPEGLYLSANIAMARILGYENREDVVRVNADRQVYIDQRQREAFKRELEEKGYINNRETQVRRRDGTPIWINENVRVVRDETGSVLYYEGSIEDVTQRKESETILREAKINSDMANRAKSEFLANMSHELRTPLNAIIGFSEIIVKEVLGPIGQKAYWEYARDIHESGGNLLKIINEILDISRIEAGDRQLNESVVDLSKVVASSIDLMASKAEAGQKVIHNRVVDVPKIVGEELAFKQIILNLLSNAIKFTPAGGTITLTSEIDPDNHLRLSVSDTGIGLDEKGIEKALSPFGQVNNELAREEAGTGLGLTLVMSLMKLHGGRFELFSQKGIGTTATIIIPAERVEVRRNKPQSSDLQTEKQF